MSFRVFWPLYLRAHQRRGTRVGHYCATAIAFTAIAASIAFGETLIWIVGIAACYGIALASHRLGDRSKSLVFVNPVWGAVADLKMCWLAITGGLATEFEQHLTQRDASRDDPHEGRLAARIAGARAS